MNVCTRGPVCTHATILISAACVLAGCNQRKAAETKPVSAKRLVGQGRRRFVQGDLDGALEKYRAAVKSRPKWAVAHNLLGMALRYKYYETGDSSYREEELTAFRTAVKLKDRWVIPRVNLATTLWQTGNQKEAARHYAKVLKLKPRHPDSAAITRRIATAAKAEANAAGP